MKKNNPPKIIDFTGTQIADFFRNNPALFRAMTLGWKVKLWLKLPPVDEKTLTLKASIEQGDGKEIAFCEGLLKSQFEEPK